MSYPTSPFPNDPSIKNILMPGNPDFLENMLPWLTRCSLFTTYRVLLSKMSIWDFKSVIDKVFMEMYGIPSEIALVAELPELLIIKRVADDVLQKPDPSFKEVIVDCGCATALLRGAHVYAPGVLGMESGIELDQTVHVYCDLYGKCTRGLSTRFKSDGKMFIGAGVCRKQRHELFSSKGKLASHGIAIEMISTISGVPSVGNLSSPVALLQHLPSIVCVHVLDPKRGERVLDMCAAPGNKTTHIAEKMENRGLIIALDKVQSKINEMKVKIHQLNYRIVKSFAYDSTVAYHANGCTFQASENIAPPYGPQVFDKILLDAPCSALGNRPVLFRKVSANQIASYTNLQRSLIATAVPLLKVGGILVYSTCTITEGENEQVVAWTLKKFPEMELVAAKPIFGGCGLPNAGLTDEQRGLVQRFGPQGYNVSNCDTIGFFIAKFQKREHKIGYMNAQEYRNFKRGVQNEPSVRDAQTQTMKVDINKNNNNNANNIKKGSV